jgi:chorismate mutase
MEYEDELKKLRVEINQLNKEIIEKITERKEIAMKIGKVKKRHGKSIVDKAREKIVYQQVKKLAIQHDLPANTVEKIFKEIINICINAEEKI